MVNGIADSMARKVELLKSMLREFANTAATLAQEIKAEEERTRITDPGHVAYSTLAKSLAIRRSNLLRSAAELETSIHDAQCALDEASVRSSAPAGAPQNPTPRAA
jgi:hypothetical protein